MAFLSNLYNSLNYVANLMTGNYQANPHKTKHITVSKKQKGTPDNREAIYTPSQHANGGAELGNTDG